MDDLNRYTIAKRTNGDYEIHHGYQAIVGNDLEVVYFSPVSERDLALLAKAKTQDEINRILSSYI